MCGRSRILADFEIEFA